MFLLFYNYVLIFIYIFLHPFSCRQWRCHESELSVKRSFVNIQIFHIDKSDGVTLVLRGKKNKVIFYINRKTWLGLIIISITLKIWNNPAFKRVRMAVLSWNSMNINWKEMKLIFLRLIEVSAENRTENLCNNATYCNIFFVRRMGKLERAARQTKILQNRSPPLSGLDIANTALNTN